MKLSNNVQYYVDFISNQSSSYVNTYIGDTEEIIKECFYLARSNKQIIYEVFDGACYSFYGHNVYETLGINYYSSYEREFDRSLYKRREYVEKFFKNYFCKKFIFFCLFNEALKTVRDIEEKKKKQKQLDILKKVFVDVKKI